MCFNGYMSGGFATIGLIMAYWVQAKTSNTKLASGIFFFFLMEALQAVQYMFLASDLGTPTCNEIINKVLTVAGFMHICLQPYFCHLINESLSQKPSADKPAAHNKKLEKYSAQFTLIKRLCLIGGFMLFIRWPLSYLPGWNVNQLGEARETEWLRGQEVCTFKRASMVHLGWSLPMADPTYVIQGVSLHSFLMFAPFFAMYEKKGMFVQGIFLFATGPFLAGLVTPNLMEQASVWCFFSIMQIAIMLVLIREALLAGWTKDSKKVVKKA